MSPVRLHVGTFTRSLLIHVAREAGKFSRANIEVVEVPVSSSPAQFRSLEAGDLDLALTSPDNVLAYRFLSDNPLGHNLPLQILLALDGGLGLSLCLEPSLSNVEEVRGRVLGVDVPESGFAFVAYELLQRAGVGASDYRVESLGSTPRRATALIAGECAATVLNAGNELRAEGAGCSVVAAANDIGPYVGTVIAALNTEDREVADLQRRFSVALVECANEILAGDYRSEILIAARSLLELNEEQARAHYYCMRAPQTGLISDGVLDHRAVQTLVELRRAYRPTTELDTIMDSLDSVIRDSAAPPR